MSKIQFVSTSKGLSEIEWARPKPAKQFIPEWFKKIPNNLPDPTIRDCPVIPDYFSMGYVMPMWMDSILTLHKQTNTFSTRSSQMFPKWEHHPELQFLDYVESNHLGLPIDFVFKAIAPWRIITEPGWSVLQLPMFYNFNKDWTVLPGIIDTDIHHEINVQVLYHGNGKEDTWINAGEGLALYIPFKREKHKLEVRDALEEDAKRFQVQSMEYYTKFAPTGVYKKKQRDRDKAKPGFLDNLRKRLES